MEQRLLNFQKWLRAQAPAEVINAYHFTRKALTNRLLTDLQRQETQQKLLLCRAEIDYRRTVH